MTLFDTETTGLVQPIAVPLDKQPRIIEFCAVKLCPKTLKELAHIDFLINPGQPLTPDITKITGLRDVDLRDAPPFQHFWAQIATFFLGETTMVAHNMDFDASLLTFELMRLGKQFHFPWPQRRICTVESSSFVERRRLRLGELYKVATGKEIQGAHRAINDVRALADCVRWLRKQGKL